MDTYCAPLVEDLFVWFVMRETSDNAQLKLMLLKHLILLQDILIANLTLIIILIL